MMLFHKSNRLLIVALVYKNLLALFIYLFILFFFTFFQNLSLSHLFFLFQKPFLL